MVLVQGGQGIHQGVLRLLRFLLEDAVLMAVLDFNITHTFIFYISTLK